MTFERKELLSLYNNLEKKTVYNGENDTKSKRPPKSTYLKSRHEIRYKHNKKGVDNEGEQTNRYNVYW